jgi:hypothetical protein
MPEATSPQGTADDTSLSFEDGVEAISNLIDDSDVDDTPNPEPKVEAQNEAEAEADEPEAQSEVEGAKDEANADEQGTGNSDEPDESEEVKGGRFAPDTAKVTLDDGTVTTIAELKRNNLFQRDYTRKTTELKAEKDTFESQRSQVGQIAQSLVAQRDFLLSAAQRFLPQPPDKTMMNPNSPSYDPIGYGHAKAEYDEAMQVINQLQYQSQAEKNRMAEEQKQSFEAIRAQEAQKLFEAVPEFRDRKVYDQFWADAVETMAAEYGFTAEEMAETTDHRMYKAMRDLVKYRKALKSAPKVKQELQAKPKVMSGSRRMDPKAKTSRDAQARSEKLRKSGDIDAAIASLMDLDL